MKRLGLIVVALATSCPDREAPIVPDRAAPIAHNTKLLAAALEA